MFISDRKRIANIFKAITLLAVTFPLSPLLTSQAFAEEATEEANAENKCDPKSPPTLSSDQLLRATRLTIADGLLDARSKERRYSLQLEWDWLPRQRDSLRNSARRNFVIPTKITIPNEALGEPSTLSRYLSPEQKELLENVLLINDLEEFDASNSNYQNFWFERTGLGFQYLRTPSAGISAAEYYDIHRENLILTNLLSSEGVEFYFSLDDENGRNFDAEIIGDFKVYSEEEKSFVANRNINWEISIYKFSDNFVDVLKDNEEVNYYRIAIKAILEEFEIRFPTDTPSDLAVKAYTSVKFNDNVLDDLSSPSSLLFSPIEVALPDPSVDSENSTYWNVDGLGTELEACLGPLRPILSGIASTGFLSSQNSDFNSGALIDFDDGEIHPFIGANFEALSLTDNISSGILFGVEPNEDSSIFLGPSLQAGMLTLSAGALLTSEGSDLDTNFSGAISLDLSPLLGSQPDVKLLELESNQAGGDWFNAINLVTENLAMVHLLLYGDRPGVCDQIGLERVFDVEESSEANNPIFSGLFSFIVKEPSEDSSETGMALDDVFFLDDISFIYPGDYRYVLPKGSEDCLVYQGGQHIKDIQNVTVQIDDSGAMNSLTRFYNDPIFLCQRGNLACAVRARG
ncbi:MAG: hypothetical protein AAF959_08195 [Cyanobacteria bacterium P01_D01_bin.56]